MKLRKQIKNRAVAVVMLAVVLFGSLSFAKPETAYANNQYYVNQILTNATPELMNKYNTYSIQTVGCSATMYAIYFSESHTLEVYFLNNEEFDLKVSLVSYNGEINDISKSKSECEGVSNHSSGAAYYYQRLSFGNHYFETVGRWDYAYKHNATVSLVTSEDLSYSEAIEKAVNYELSDTFFKTDKTDSDSIDKDMSKGNQDNPQNDEDIGYLVLKTTNTNTQTDLDVLKNGIQSVHYNLDWENKTSTGFSLSKNKYARTFIQFEVESQYVVYSDAKHTKIKHKFDNYGERGWIAKNWDATSKPFSLTTDQVNAALPKSTDEVLTQFDQNKIYQSGFTNGNIAINPLAFNFKIRYRVVCTNDIAVIPDSSGGWHAGPWASTVISGDEINDTSSHKSNHEGYGDDKNDNGESDDINHTKTDYDDNQDAKDHINDKPSDNDSELTIDKAISFVKQVAKVPKLIGLAMSWLPDWVTAPFYLAFALIPILIIYKFLRG